MKISVKVIPKASKNETVGWREDTLKVGLIVVPKKGKTNEVLIALLSKEYWVSKSHSTILIRGYKSK